MKTEILLQHKTEEGYFISGIVPLRDNCCAVLSTNFSDIYKIEIVGEKSFNITVDNPLYRDVFHNSFFKYKEGFGLSYLTEELILWDSIDTAKYKTRIVNPLKRDKFNRYHYVTSASYCEQDKSLYCLVNDIGRLGFPARYWTRLRLIENSLFSFFKKEFIGRWNSKFELNKKNYPITFFSQLMQDKFPNYADDWLSIKEIMVNQENVYVHTIGGATTRNKSGKSFEFSIVSKLSKDNELIANYNVEEGQGKFSSSKEYFILQKRSNKKKLAFYNINTFEVDFEITLNSKLSPSMRGYLNTDFYDGRLYLFGGNTLNVISVVE